MESTLAEQLATMQRRLARLEAERDIMKLFADYGHAVDAGEEETWVRCFTEDGHFSAVGPDESRPPLDVVGRAALRAFAAKHSRRPHLYHQHGQFESRLELDDDATAAACVTYFIVMMRWHPTDPTRHEPVVRSFGRYTDVLVKDTDGAWRLRSRHADLDAGTRGLPPLVNAMTPGARSPG